MLPTVNHRKYQKSKAGRRPRVMIVDDSAVDRFVIENVLRRADVSTVTESFENAEDALHRLLNEPLNKKPDVVFVDLNMPGMTGFDFLHAFKRLPAPIKRGCRIVLLSSSVTAADITEGKASPHVMMYVEKPLTIEKVMEIFGKMKGGR